MRRARRSARSFTPAEPIDGRSTRGRVWGAVRFAQTSVRPSRGILPAIPVADPERTLEPERGLLLAVLPHGADEDDELGELAELARAAGVAPVANVVQHRARSDPRTYVGKGKLDELKDVYASSRAEVLLVDDELKPTQQRALEDALSARVVDRTQLILDIFAQHAVSAEGKLQVELAQLEYNLPRMTSGSANSSTSSSPSSASRAASRVEVIPDARLAPDRFQASRRTGERIELAIAVVVVLPLVADTSATPAGRRCASASSASGSSFHTSFPGSVVPPPARVLRDRPAAARAAATLAVNAVTSRTLPRGALTLPQSTDVLLAQFASFAITSARRNHPGGLRTMRRKTVYRAIEGIDRTQLEQFQAGMACRLA